MFPEREPKRELKIQENNQIKLKDSMFDNQFSQKGCIINGILKVQNDEYIPPFMVFKVATTNILIGSYPESEDDVIELRHNGVNGLLNFMTSSEMRLH